MAEHSMISPSKSEMVIHCPPSARLNAKVGDRPSPYAQEGTDAHSLCQYLVEKALGHNPRDPTENLSFYNAEMQEAAEGYCGFVLEQIEQVKKAGSTPRVYVEERLDLSEWIPEAFGTADCLILTDGLLHVIDFKYGMGVPVSAAGSDGEGNSQLKCYALGAYAAYGFLYDIETVRLTVYQPRLENVSTYELSLEDLLTWARDVLSPAAHLAYEGKGDFSAGEHCRFCKVKASCRARAAHNMALAQYEFAAAPSLTQEEIADILERADELTSWADDVKAYALEQALLGTHFPHFKLVSGRSNRKYSDEAAVAKVVSDAGYDPYEKKLLGITAMTKQLGKKKFDELLGGLVTKPQGKPTLVPDTDKRPELNTNTAEKDFMEDVS